MRNSSFLLLTVLAAGCGGTTAHYTAGPTMAKERRHRFSTAVLPFEDKTPDFRISKERGFHRVNLAKSAHPNLLSPMTPELLASFLAQELDASELFDGARYAVDASELGPEKLVVEGAVTEALSEAGVRTYRCAFALELRARRLPDGPSIWTRSGRAEYLFNNVNTPEFQGLNSISIEGRPPSVQTHVRQDWDAPQDCPMVLQRLFRELIADLNAAL